MRGLMPEKESDLVGLELAIAKLDDEPNVAYMGFLQYVQLLGADRSQEKVMELTGFSYRQVYEWATSFNWMERADKVDAQRWLREHKEREKLLAADNKRYIEANREIKDRSIETAKKMLRVADGLLETAQQAGKVTEGDYVETKDGRKVPTRTTIEMKAKISDIPRLAQVAVHIARAASDLPTEIINELGIEPGTDLSDLSLDQLEALRDKNRKRLLEKGAIQQLGTAD